jgi:apoptosis-inducing factor 3
MVQQEKKLAGPDLTQGIALDELPDGGVLVGHAGDKQILLVRRGSEVFAVGAQCTHYQGPLAEGLLVGDTVRCPWHHACFDLRTGEALRAPAIDPIGCWDVAQRDGLILVGNKRKAQKLEQRAQAAGAPEKIVIVGGGAAGFAAAEMLRRKGYQGSLLMLSSEASLPCDRPNLSKETPGYRGRTCAPYRPRRRSITRAHAALIGRLPSDHRGGKVVTSGCRDWGKLYWA